MNNAEIQKKKEIESALAKIPDSDFLQTAKNLLAVLGYRSQRTGKFWETVDEFIETLPARNRNTNTEREFREDVESVELVFQVTDDEVNTSDQGTLFESPAFDEGNAKSFMFFTVQLKAKDYPRSKYAQFTREINKRIIMPVVVLFCVKSSCFHPLGCVENRLTLCFVGRRPHKGDPDRDVLEQVTLIKDIRLNNPHRAHLEVLFELSLAECAKWMDDHNQPETFDGLLAAWLARLDTEELNKQFYQKLFNWFEWAVAEAKFPTNETRVLKPEEHVIRLITRLLFVWFIKEKGLVAEELFNETQVAPLLDAYDRDSGDSYYRAVLQNLFFATLNTEIKKRQFSPRTNVKHRNFSVYRYKTQISNPDKLLGLFAQTPFINGGLFDCLDSEEATRDGGYRIDCFSDEHYDRLSIPNRLFFDDEHGLIPLLNHYKFTVQENTPIEQEVALDPELLGKVFENLLAAYNPETGATARKQTGSYYTPRAIVDYMVEEALTATLAGQVSPTDGDAKAWAERLRALFDYTKAFDNTVGVGSPNPSPNPHFDARESGAVVRAISELKILDPAVGSGAFPMGVLHKLTLALRRLDPDNNRWEALQKERARQRAAAAFDTQNQRERDAELTEISDIFERYRDSDFGRKLYLIQNSIFGLDIQSIACQIAKLRFFISLAIEQEPDQNADNFGVKPLPNLETRFITSNTLIGLESERTLTSPKAKALERKLGENRERHFHATTRSQKRACKRTDRTVRRELAKELKTVGMPADDAKKIADWDAYDQNASADWFDPEWMFGVADGFDVVIGNPPYVRQEKIKALKPTLKDQYDCYTGTADLYVYFYERGFQLLRADGTLTYISSNKYFRAAYGKKLRDLLTRQSTLSQLIDFGDAPVFTSIAYPSIITGHKTLAEGNHLRAMNWEPGPSINELGPIFRTHGFTMPQAALTADGWRLTAPAMLNLLEKLRNAGKPLGEFVKRRFYRGILTGLNEAFVVDRETRDELIAEHPSSAEVLKPFLRGRDVKRWQVNFAEQYLITIESSENRAHPWSGQSAEEAEQIFAKTYPAIYAHLQAFREQLIKRYDQGKYFWEFRACAYWAEFERPKIVYPDIAQGTEFSFDDERYFLGNTLYLLPTKEMWLLGLLNSRAVFWFYTKTSTQIRGGFVRFIAQYVSQIPIPDMVPTQKARISKLVNQILAAKQANPNADVSDLENEIDQIVYSLYCLTADEIAIVAEGTQ